MLCDERERAREFLRTIQRELESLLDQQAILVIEREISRLE
jgi:hypothetical protein